MILCLMIEYVVLYFDPKDDSSGLRQGLGDLLPGLSAWGVWTYTYMLCYDILY